MHRLFLLNKAMSSDSCTGSPLGCSPLASDIEHSAMGLLVLVTEETKMQFPPLDSGALSPSLLNIDQASADFLFRHSRYFGLCSRKVCAVVPSSAVVVPKPLQTMHRWTGMAVMVALAVKSLCIIC